LSFARTLCLTHHHTSRIGEGGVEMDAGDPLAADAAERLPIHGERLVGAHGVLVEPTMDHRLERRYIEPSEHFRYGVKSESTRDCLEHAGVLHVLGHKC
jgi:hypothetical protein